MGPDPVHLKRWCQSSEENLIQGAKRKYECLTSWFRQFEMTAKKLATWKPTAENRPVPVYCRLVQKEYFNFVSSAGEASAGEITMINPDHSQKVNRYKCTRSFDYNYRCISCKSGHSVLEPRHCHYNKMAYDEIYSIFFARSQICLILFHF